MNASDRGAKENLQVEVTVGVAAIVVSVTVGSGFAVVVIVDVGESKYTVKMPSGCGRW
jgi:hypothetical protein